MNGNRKAIKHESVALLIAAIAGSIASFGTLPCTGAPAAQAPRIVDYVSPSLLSPQASLSAPTKPRATMTEEATEPRWEKIIQPKKTVTSGDRWLQFENEYGIQQKNPTRIGRMLQTAKYGLDKMTFTAQEAARRLEFTYDIGGPSPTVSDGLTANPGYSLPLFGKFGQARLKSVLTEHDPQTGTPFIGLKLVIPFGQGG